MDGEDVREDEHEKERGRGEDREIVVGCVLCFGVGVREGIKCEKRHGVLSRVCVVREGRKGSEMHADRGRTGKK